MAKTPWAELIEPFLKTGGTKTEEIIAKSSKGVADNIVEPLAPKEEVVTVQDQTQPVQTKKVETQPIDPTKPVIEEEKAAEILTEKTGFEGGRPSGEDITQRNINFDNIETSDEVLQLIDNVGKQKGQFVEARGGVVSQQETIAKSDKVALEDILGFKLGDGVSPERITGARLALVESAENLKVMSKKILDGNATTEEKLAFRQMVATHVGIQQSVAGMSAEAGRSLNAFRIPAGKQVGETTAVYRSQLQEAFERSGGDDVAIQLAEFVTEHADDLGSMNSKIRKVHLASTRDIITEVWINGLLSSPATHSVNVTSNAMVSLWSIPERLLAGAGRKMFGKDGGVEMEEAIAQTFGLIQGIKDALRIYSFKTGNWDLGPFWKALKEGEPTDPAMKMEMRDYRAISAQNLGINKDNMFAKGIDFLGNLIRLPGRFLGAEDELFKTIGYRMELNALAFRKARSEGLKGKELSERVVDLINNPTGELHLDAQNFARTQTFTNDLGPGGKKFQQIANDVPGLKFIVPFIRTPVNIAKFVGMRSPLAPLAKSWWADIGAGGARRDMALAKFGMGSSIMMYGVSLGMDGSITGRGPRNTAQRQALERQGWQPYSIKIGDKYYSFNRADPLGMFLGLAADVADTMRYTTDDEDIFTLASASVFALINNITSKTYLSGVADLANAISDPDRYFDGFKKRFGASLVPYSALIANIEREIDPTVRATYDVMDQIISRTPGLSDTLPPRRNLWGEPIVLEGGLGWDFISPFYTKTERFDFVSKQMADNEMNITMPKRKFGQYPYDIELDGEQYDKLILLAGKEIHLPYKDPDTRQSKGDKNLHDFLKSVMMTDIYQEATDGPQGGKTMMIKNIVHQFQEAARAELKNEYPELRDKEIELKAQKIEDRTGKDVQDTLNELNMRL